MSSSDVQEVFGAAEALAIATLPGGPVELPLAELPRLYRLLWWADDSTRPGLQVAGAALEGVDWSAADDAEPLWEDGGVRVAWPETGARWGDLDRLERLGILLKDLPAGAQVEFVGWGEHEFSRQRFAGRTVAPGLWAIEAATFGVPADVLRRALAMSEAAERADAVEAESEELAAEAAERATREWGQGITAEGKRLYARDEDGTDRMMLGLAAASLFLLSFREHWPLAEFLEEEDDGGEMAELAAQLTRMGQSLGQAMARAQGAPPAGRLVLKGQHGEWNEGNLAGLPFVAPEDVAWMDREMVALGLRVLGDLTGSPIPGTILRGYGHPQGSCYGTATASAGGEFLYEFVSAFSDGSGLTTTTMPGARDEPRRKALKRSHPEAGVAELFALHEAEAARLQQEGRVLRESEPELVGLARAVDEFVGRMRG